MSILLINAVCAFTFYSLGRKTKISANNFNENALVFEDQNRYLLRKKMILNAVLTTGESKF